MDCHFYLCPESNEFAQKKLVHNLNLFPKKIYVIGNKDTGEKV